MQKKSYILFFPFLLLLFSNCSTSLKLQSVEELPNIYVKTVKRTSKDSTYILSGKKYRFPNTVQEIQYKPSWQQLAVNFQTAKRKNAYAIYDIAAEKLNWTNKGNYQLTMLQSDVAIVSSTEKRLLVNAKSGLPIRWVAPAEDFAVIDDSITLNLTKQFSKIDLKTGETQWSRPGANRFEGWITDELDGDWMYVMADGLHGFNLKTGSGWHQQVNTDYDATRGKKALYNGLLLGLDILTLANTGGSLVSGLAGDVLGEFLYLNPLRCLLYTSPSPRDATLSRMPSSA